MKKMSAFLRNHLFAVVALAVILLAATYGLARINPDFGHSKYYPDSPWSLDGKIVDANGTDVTGGTVTVPYAGDSTGYPHAETVGYDVDTYEIIDDQGGISGPYFEGDGSWAKMGVVIYQRQGGGKPGVWGPGIYTMTATWEDDDSPQGDEGSSRDASFTRTATVVFQGNPNERYWIPSIPTDTPLQARLMFGGKPIVGTAKIPRLKATTQGPTGFELKTIGEDFDEYVEVTSDLSYTVIERHPTGIWDDPIITITTRPDGSGVEVEGRRVDNVPTPAPGLGTVQDADIGDTASVDFLPEDDDKIYTYFYPSPDPITVWALVDGHRVNGNPTVVVRPGSSANVTFAASDTDSWDQYKNGQLYTPLTLLHSSPSPVTESVTPYGSGPLAPYTTHITATVTDTDTSQADDVTIFGTTMDPPVNASATVINAVAPTLDISPAEQTLYPDQDGWVTVTVSPADVYTVNVDFGGLYHVEISAPDSPVKTYRVHGSEIRIYTVTATIDPFDWGQGVILPETPLVKTCKVKVRGVPDHWIPDPPAVQGLLWADVLDDDWPGHHVPSGSRVFTNFIPSKHRLSDYLVANGNVTEDFDTWVCFNEDPNIWAEEATQYGLGDRGDYMPWYSYWGGKDQQYNPTVSAPTLVTLPVVMLDEDEEEGRRDGPLNWDLDVYIARAKMTPKIHYMGVSGLKDDVISLALTGEVQPAELVPYIDTEKTVWSINAWRGEGAPAGLYFIDQAGNHVTRLDHTNASGPLYSVQLYSESPSLAFNSDSVSVSFTTVPDSLGHRIQIGDGQILNLVQPDIQICYAGEGIEETRGAFVGLDNDHDNGAYWIEDRNLAGQDGSPIQVPNDDDYRVITLTVKGPVPTQQSGGYLEARLSAESGGNCVRLWTKPVNGTLIDFGGEGWKFRICPSVSDPNMKYVDGWSGSVCLQGIEHSQSVADISLKLEIVGGSDPVYGTEGMFPSDTTPADLAKLTCVLIDLTPDGIQNTLSGQVDPDGRPLTEEAAETIPGMAVTACTNPQTASDLTKVYMSVIPVVPDSTFLVNIVANPKPANYPLGLAWSSDPLILGCRVISTGPSGDVFEAFSHFHSCSWEIVDDSSLWPGYFYVVGAVPGPLRHDQIQADLRVDGHTLYGDRVNATIVPKIHADIAMDGNHDSDVDFDQPLDKDYVFWLNNDSDVSQFSILEHQQQEDDDAEGLSDCEDDLIGHYYLGDPTFDVNTPLSPTQGCWRDLEDMTRLHVLADVPTDSQADCRFTLSFENASGDPSVNLFRAVVPGLDYQTDPRLADLQVREKRLLTVDALDVSPRDLTLDQISYSGDRSCFLLEGRSGGEGDLTLTAIYKDIVLQKRSVHLRLADITEFYDKYVVPDLGGGSVGPNYTTVHEATVRTSTDDSRYFLYVHGWNMSDFDKNRWAETVFKRLFWTGYTGRYGCLQWPTLTGVFTYNDSDFRAWRSGQALSNLLVSLNGSCPGQVRVLAHSMGNVVTGEALRTMAPGDQPKYYLAAQAAVSATCYDAAVPPGTRWMFDSPDCLGHYWSGNSPDQPYMIDNSTKVSQGGLIRYHNQYDWALGKWDINNSLKPGLSYDYYPLYDLWYRRFGDYLHFPVDRFEVFSYAAESRSRALGAVSVPVAGFASEKSLEYFGNKHYGHSLEFRSNMVDTGDFWQSVADDMMLRAEEQ